MHPVVLTYSYTCDFVLNDIHLNPNKECVTNQQVAVSVPGTMHVVILTGCDASREKKALAKEKRTKEEKEQGRKCRTSNRNKMHIEKVRTR